MPPAFRDMKKTDMELQAIREKLRSLQAEPPAAEALPMPWSQPRPPASAPPRRPEPPSENRQAQAIEALQQRSRSQEAAVHTRADDLLAQEIYRLEVQAHKINARSQQQAADLMAMKRSAQQATIALARQGIHEHPQLGAIAEFFASYQSVDIPRIDRDSQGFTLSYTTIDFDHAEQAAADVAQSLRQRSSSGLFSQPIESSAASSHRPVDRESKPEQAVAIYSAVFESEWLQAAMESIVSRFYHLRRQLRRHPSQNVPIRPWSQGAVSAVRPNTGEQPRSDGYSSRPYSSQYSLLDGAIWFSGAAIALIVIKTIILSDSLIRTSVIAALFGVIGFALYQVVFSKSSDYSLLYRLFIAMAGLLLASFASGLF